jgi:hypothetical protein
MSAGVFPPTSSRSTRPRTSTRTLEFAGYADSMKARCPSGSAPAFLRRRRGRPDRIVGSRGGRGPSPQRGGPGGDGSPGEKSRPGPDGRPDRPGPTMRLLVRGPRVLSEPSLAFPRGPSLATSPSPRCSLPQAHAALTEPALLLAQARSCFLRCFSPGPTLCAHAPPLSSALLALVSTPADATWPAENGRSLAAYLARYWEHGSHLRGLMRMNDPCPGNVLI